MRPLYTLFTLLILLPIASGYTQAELDQTNTTILGAQNTIVQVEAILNASPNLADDLEISLKLGEARLKINTSRSYLEAAQDNNATNPTLASNFLNLASSSATEAVSLAETARILAVAKNLAEAAIEEEMKKKIESISSDMTSYSEDSKTLNTTINALQEEIDQLKAKGVSTTSPEEKLQEARVLLDHGDDLFNSTGTSFEAKDYDRAQTSITAALADLDDAGVKVASASSLMDLAKTDVTLQEKDLDVLMNRTGILLEESSLDLDASLGGLDILEDYGMSIENFNKLLSSNSQHLSNARQYYDKAVFRKNFQDLVQAREFSLMALEELEAFDRRQGDLMESLLAVIEPETRVALNHTGQKLAEAESNYRKTLSTLDGTHLTYADETISKARTAIAEAGRKMEHSSLLWEEGNMSMALTEYNRVQSKLGEGTTNLALLDGVLESTMEKGISQENLALLKELSTERFSGITQTDINEFQALYLEATGDYDDQEYTTAHGKFKEDNERAQALMEKDQRSRTSIYRGGLLAAYSVFLILVMGLFEISRRRKR